MPTQPETSPQMGGDGRGGEDGRAVALEGERGQQAHAVELGPGPQLHPGRLHGGVDLGPKRRSRARGGGARTGCRSAMSMRVDPRQGVVVDRDHEDEVLLEERLEDEVASGDGKVSTARSKRPAASWGSRPEVVPSATTRRRFGMAGRRGRPSSTGTSQRAVVPIMPTRTVPATSSRRAPRSAASGVELAQDPVGPGHHHLAFGGQPARPSGRPGWSPAPSPAGPRGPRCWTGRCPGRRRRPRTTRARTPPPGPAGVGVPSLLEIPEICNSCLTDRGRSLTMISQRPQERTPPLRSLSSRCEGTGSPSGPFAASGPDAGAESAGPGRGRRIGLRHGDGPLAEDPSCTTATARRTVRRRQRRQRSSSTSTGPCCAGPAAWS